MGYAAALSVVLLLIINLFSKLSEIIRDKGEIMARGKSFMQSRPFRLNQLPYCWRFLISFYFVAVDIYF